MKVKICLIRGGATKGGMAGKYLGILDEELLEEQALELRQRSEQGKYPGCELVYTSGLLRCRQAGALIYPGAPLIVMKGLEALDIGAYSGRLYHEILSDKHFAHWAQSPELRPLAGGEELHAFFSRCTAAFRRITGEMLSKGIGEASVIAHRLVIAAIMRRYIAPRNPYRNWDVGWGRGYVIEYNTRLSVARVLNKV